MNYLLFASRITYSNVKGYMALLLRLALVSLVTLGLIKVSVSASTPTEELVTFVFGDSLTEVGNNNYLQYSLAKSNYPWYGIDYKGGQATGRFTNGRTIGDIICNTHA